MTSPFRQGLFRPALNTRAAVRSLSSISPAITACASARADHQRGSVGRYSTATSPSSKPLQLYTAGTPNGRKVHIYLEELKTQYGLTYQCANPSICLRALSVD